MKIWLVFVLLFALMTPWMSQIDLSLSNYFFKDGHFSDNPLFTFLFDYSIFLAWGLVFVGFILLFFKNYRRIGTYLILTFAIGAGLIVHVALKEHWGRPRPRQVVEFGGTEPYRAYYKPNSIVQGKSFSCGHCTMGFYFFTLAFLGSYYRNKRIYFLGMILAWGLGVLLSITRIAQGGHFFSDTIMSGLIMWFVSWVLFKILFQTKYERINAKTT